MKRSLLFVALMMVVAFSGFWSGAYWERNREIPFNAVLWRVGGPSQTIARDVDPFRHKMVGDLLAKHVHNGMSRAQVVQLLGEPENQVDAQREIWYWLNQEYSSWAVGIDPKTTHNLVVQFDPSGKVEKVSQQLYAR